MFTRVKLRAPAVRKNIDGLKEFVGLTGFHLDHDAVHVVAHEAGGLVHSTTLERVTQLLQYCKWRRPVRTTTPALLSWRRQGLRQYPAAGLAQPAHPAANRATRRQLKCQLGRYRRMGR